MAGTMMMMMSRRVSCVPTASWIRFRQVSPSGVLLGSRMIHITTTRLHRGEQKTMEGTVATASGGEQEESPAPTNTATSAFTPDAVLGNSTTPSEVEPVRWMQESHKNTGETQPIVDENGQFIVSRVQWPTGEIAYTTPPPPDGKLTPRFGYNVLQVKKDMSWWKHYHKYPRISVAYINIQVLFLLGAAWLMAFLTEELRRTTDEMKTPGAMVGEHRGRGPANRQTQKVAFTNEEMENLVGRAQDNWLDAKAEANYIGSKDYNMKKIPRPKEFSMEDFRKR